MRSVDRFGTVVDPKTAAGVRTIPLPDHLLMPLKVWKLKAPKREGAAALMFPDANGGMQSQDATLEALRRALRKAGLPPLRLHDLRHLYVSLLVASGEDIKRVQELAGHAHIGTTLGIYAHVLKRKHDDSANAVARLAGLVRGNILETSTGKQVEESNLSHGAPGRI
jgi:integrase